MAQVARRTPLTGMESVIWRVGSDPALSSTFGTVSFLERPPDRDHFTRRLGQAVAAMPRLRQRIRPSGIPGTPPWWEDDPDFDLSHHLRWAELGEGAGSDRRAVLDSAEARLGEPLDSDRPPWELVVVTGLDGGQAALLLRMHHAVSDGEGGVRLSELFVDVSPDDTAGPTPDPFVGGDAPEPATTWGERAALTLAERAGEAVRASGQLAQWTVDGLADPNRFVDAGRDAVDAAASLRRQLLVLDPARSPLWADRSRRRRLVVASVPFEPVHDAAKAAGASLNDAFLTAVLRGAGNYHRVKGGPVDELRAAVPVSTRQGESVGGNAFSITRAVLPAGDGLTAAVHLSRVHERMASTKRERSAVLTSQLAGVAELVPTPLLTAAFRQQTSTIDLVTSNVRAAPFPLYVGGAEVEATYVLGPLLGTPVNVTMMSYNGRLDLGIHVDEAAVDDADLLRDTIVGAFHELIELASPA